MKTFEVVTPWCTTPDCVLTLDAYAGNNHYALSVWSLSEGPFANITVNLPETSPHPANYGYVDVNNFPEAEALIARLGIGSPVGETAASGFCVYPLYEFNGSAIAEYLWVPSEDEEDDNFEV